MTVTASPGPIARSACRSTPEVSTTTERPSEVCSFSSDTPTDSTEPSSDCAAADTLAEGALADGVPVEGALAPAVPGWIHTPTISCRGHCSSYSVAGWFGARYSRPLTLLTSTGSTSPSRVLNSTRWRPASWTVPLTD